MGKRKYTEQKTVSSIRLSNNERELIIKSGYPSLQSFIEDSLKSIDVVVAINKKKEK